MFIEAKDDGGGGDNWATGAINRAKLQSNHHHQQTTSGFFYRPDALPVAQPTVSKHCREGASDPDLHISKFGLSAPSTPSSLLQFNHELLDIRVPAYSDCRGNRLLSEYDI